MSMGAGISSHGRVCREDNRAKEAGTTLPGLFEAKMMYLIRVGVAFPKERLVSVSARSPHLEEPCRPGTFPSRPPNCACSFPTNG